MLLKYTDVTKELRLDEMLNDARLFTCVRIPHKCVSKVTIACWVRTRLCMSGIDTSKCSAGSVRPAAVSKARGAAVPVSCIVAKMGWYRESALVKYYNDIVAVSDPVQGAVLE